MFAIIVIAATLLFGGGNATPAYAATVDASSVQLEDNGGVSASVSTGSDGSITTYVG